jgi:hypothetical protein
MSRFPGSFELLLEGLYRQMRCRADRDAGSSRRVVRLRYGRKCAENMFSADPLIQRGEYRD